MADSGLKPIKRVNSSHENSFQALVFIHRMIVFVNSWHIASAKHSVLHPDQGRYGINLLLMIVTSIMLILALGRPVWADDGSSSPGSQAQTAPIVALASSLRTVWPALMDAYIRTNNAPGAKASFASSGLLTTQIRHGAPFELFLSADASTVSLLHSLGKSADEGIALAFGTLSLVTPADSAAALKGTGLEGLIEALSRANPDSEGTNNAFKLAIPNPRHAPYGMAAQQLLGNTGIWPLPEGQLLHAENAAQALQYALNSAVDYAFVPTTLLANSNYALHSWPLDIKNYEPIRHQMVLLENAGTSATSLYTWLQGKHAASILRNAGLSPAR